MFKRFSSGYENLFRTSRDYSVASGDTHVRDEHVLVGCTATAELEPALAAHRCTRQVAERIATEMLRDRQATGDAARLRSLGIDLDEVRSEIESAFGPGALERARSLRTGRRSGVVRWCRRHLPRRMTSDGSPIIASNFQPFADETKKTLELALRVALGRNAKTVATSDLLVALLDPEHNARLVDQLERSGVDTAALTNELRLH